MIEVTAYDKAVTRAAARAIGGEPRVIETEMEYWNLDRGSLA